MAVFKVEKRKNYTIMSNHHLQNKNLSLKAKGLLSYMLSLPEDWDYSLAGLEANCKESKTALTTALHELKQNGYVIIEKMYANQTKSKRIEYVYNIFEEPHLEPGIHKQDTENQYLDFQDVDFNTQQNTNKQIIKEQIDKNDKTKSSNIFENSHNYLTIELIERGYILKTDSQIYYYDNLFEKLLQEHELSDLLMIIHYIIPRILERDFNDEYGNKIQNKYGLFKVFYFEQYK